MTIIELLIIALGVSMDAFAVALGKGLSVSNIQTKHIVIVGIYFGLFQAIMPIIGYFLAFNFQQYIVAFDHWIAFVLLLFIGFKMIKEAYSTDEKIDYDFSMKTMVTLSIATSIDALAVGVSFAFLNINIIQSSTIIGITTMILSMIATKIRSIANSKLKFYAEILGGILIIMMGIKILLDHLGYL